MNKEFWIDTLERCIWTFAETMLGLIAVGQTIESIAWKHALSVSAVATLICLLKQFTIAFGKEGDE